jgi:TetR/AcrR family transcriptional regulator
MSKPGERKLQILQVLAEMLESPTPEKITTAALAARLDVSEAALYRHFASKAQMYEGLIEFIETTLFGLVNKLSGEGRGLEQVRGITQMLLGFAEKNRGMTRMLTGEVLVNENARLQARMNQLMDRLEASLKQSLRIAASEGSLSPQAEPGSTANLILAYVLGRWQQFVKSGFKRLPMEHWEAQWQILAVSLATTQSASAAAY